MGTWSTEILGDDFACDVYGEFMDMYDAGEQTKSIRLKLQKKNAFKITDSDNGPIFWLALANAQWDCGILDEDVRQKISEIVEKGLGLERWKEGTATGLDARCKELNKFWKKIQIQNPSSRLRQKRQVFHPIFKPGDCLVVKLPTGEFGAALVLATDEKSQEYGKDLIGLLAFRRKTKPTLMDFESRKWLVKERGFLFGKKEVIWFFARTFSECASAIEKIGMVKLRWTDPKTSKVSCPNWRTLLTKIEKSQ